MMAGMCECKINVELCGGDWIEIISSLSWNCSNPCHLQHRETEIIRIPKWHIGTLIEKLQKLKDETP